MSRGPFHGIYPGKVENNIDPLGMARILVSVADVGGSSALSWALPWYVLWLLPLAALARRRGLRVAALVISAYLLVIWMPNMTDVIHAVGYKPSLTLLGQERQQKTLLLLH